MNECIADRTSSATVDVGINVVRTMSRNGDWLWRLSSAVHILRGRENKCGHLY